MDISKGAERAKEIKGVVKYFGRATKMFTRLYEKAWEVPSMSMPLCQRTRLSKIGLHLGRYARATALPLTGAF